MSDKLNDKFDPNATPECDAQRYVNHDGLSWKLEAQALERQKRILEEKLRIAVEALEKIGCMAFAEDVNAALKQIEEVGKWRN